MYNVEVIKTCAEHIDDLMIVERLSFKIPWSRESILEEINGNKYARYLSARIGGRIVGYAGMWSVFGEGHITNIAVHPEFRGGGIGTLLMEKLIEAAVSENITAMTLEVRKSNITAQNLYKKFGFVEYGLRKAYYADNGEDALIMWKHSF